ncbi:spore germination protein GerPE [Pueribacillus sp. YX66]|uniref:spore germination protein GerPE n=1 Tax=Pueribacillus sp. YX66 TaxID=3229242 RepID=UPI00358D8B30
MTKRTSTVLTVKVNEVQSSSVFQIGDSFAYTPKSRGYAVSQLSPYFIDEPFVFNAPIFYEPIPQPVVSHPIIIDTFHDSSFIHVGHVKINSLGNSSVFQIGSSNYIHAEARIKHVRRK